MQSFNDGSDEHPWQRWMSNHHASEQGVKQQTGKVDSKGNQQSKIEQQQDVGQHEPHNEDDLEIDFREPTKPAETFQEHLP